ncbi:5'-nucleotidase C-terminal domain-containing protein [Ammoniphilus sp. YIM 78166]|uniref:5'-nucleotidase C-terminal domain-containing protein n=1 Tax=Ammoniphilus sp. YIM 78166 TaxID=1644106 RepID=UPI0010700137|nr:5'-nucleotidase C-terminal domain-containing protein [Ammoniphilus sp. YIM 78166]
MRRSMSIFMALFLALSVWLPSIGARTVEAAEGKRITILYTNDIHSRFEESSSAGMGYAKIAALVKQHRAENPNTLVLDAGDTFHGQTITTLVQGESIIPVMNEIGYDAMTAGNHDFNYGMDRLLEIKGKLNFPVMGGNVVNRADGKPVLDSYVIKELDGIKIGIFGIATPETAYKTHPKNVKTVQFLDPVAHSKKMVEQLEQERVNVIIGLAHLGMDESSQHTSRLVAEQVKGIDVIIDGHSHQVFTDLMIGETLITQAGEYSKNLGVVNLTFDKGTLTEKKASIISKEDAKDVIPDPEITKIIEDIKSSQAQVLEEVIGTAAVKLEGEREKVRAGETNLGNLISSAMLKSTEADVALTNGGGIRASIEQGTVTKGNIITVLPFGNYVVTIKVTGSELQAALEHGAGQYPEPKGAFPHVAGLTFKIDPDQPEGQRIHSVFVAGKPLNANQEYILATNDFLAAGGDDYKMFAQKPVLNHYPTLDEIVIDYLQNQQAIPIIESRVTVEAIKGHESQPVQQPAVSEVVKSQPAWYVVKKGDTLSKIAQSHGTVWKKLQELNKLRNPHLIFPGQKILLP